MSGHVVARVKIGDELARLLARDLLAAACADLREGVPLAQRLEDAAPAVLGPILASIAVRLTRVAVDGAEVPLGSLPEIPPGDTIELELRNAT